MSSLQSESGWYSFNAHVNYSETVLRMKDGLPKLKDFPKEFGGSGEVVAE